MWTTRLGGALSPPNAATLPATPLDRAMALTSYDSPPMHAVDEDSSEERQKDLVTFRIGSRRRVLLVFAVGAAAFAAVVAGLMNVPLAVPPLIVVAGLLTNRVLMRVATHGKHRAWYRYAFCTLDLLLLSCPVAVWGEGGLITFYMIAIVPYSFDQGRALGYFSAVMSTLLFVAARVAYWLAHPGQTHPVGETLVAAAALLLAATQIVPIASKLIRRVRRTRARMYVAEHGDLRVRAEARYSDELGFLERSFNRMLEQLGELIGGVQRETHQVAGLADQ